VSEKVTKFWDGNYFLLHQSRQNLTRFNTITVQFEISSKDFIRKIPKAFQVKEIKTIFGVQTDELLPYTNNGVFLSLKKSVRKIV
jgi:hypothetical protein